MFKLLHFVHSNWTSPCLCLRWARGLQPWNRRSKDLVMERKWKMSVFLWTRLTLSVYRCSNLWRSVFCAFLSSSVLPCSWGEKSCTWSPSWRGQNVRAPPTWLKFGRWALHLKKGKRVLSLFTGTIKISPHGDTDWTVIQAHLTYCPSILWYTYIHVLNDCFATSADRS